MIRAILVTCFFGQLIDLAVAQSVVKTKDEFNETVPNLPPGRTVTFDQPGRDGWTKRMFFYHGLGDSGGDDRYYFSPFSANELSNLEEANGIYACYGQNSQEKPAYTAGRFDIGYKPATVKDRKTKLDKTVQKRYANVSRDVTQPKELSTDQKNVLNAGKDFLQAIPELGNEAAQEWEKLYYMVVKPRRGGRFDQSPTIDGKTEMFLSNGSFTFTVERFYNCRVNVVYKLK